MARTKGTLLPLRMGLSARLLVLTIAFVMLSEVLIFVPSIARYRLVYLEERIAASHLATLALEASPDYMIAPGLERELLRHAGVRAVVLMRPESRTLALGYDMPPKVAAAFDLREATPASLIRDAFDTLRQASNRVIHVAAPAPNEPGVVVDVILDEDPLRAGMYDYAGRILQLSIVISLITAWLVYLALQWLMVRPMRRITQNMVDFRAAPEDEAGSVQPSSRGDEIGTTQRELAELQAQVRASLKQNARLAALGIAVSKINHDLRNILATARLVSDRLANSDDPNVRRVTPTLVRAIDRAVDLCTNTLRYGRAEEPDPVRARFGLRELVDDVAGALSHGMPASIVWHNEVGADFEVNADRDQIYRVLLNLGRNAIEAMAHLNRGEICVRAIHVDSVAQIDFSDTGPGLTPEVRDKLFVAFSGSSRAGGTGLGLAIARDLMKAHDGDIRLLETEPSWTTFRLELPAS